MRRSFVALACGLALIPLAAGTETAAAAHRAKKLSPAEQKWVKPLISVWNIQNAGLHLVVQQAAAKNALVAGAKPNNLTLTRTLTALLSCKSPTDRIKKAGKPPSKRLRTFRNALNAACIHNANGANDFAKAIGAVTKGNGTQAGKLLKDGVAEFKRGSAMVTKAYKALTAIGGKVAFKA